MTQVTLAARPNSPVTKTANYTMAALDSVVLADATAGAITITLPTAPVVGAVYGVMKTDTSANQVIVAPGAGVLNGHARLTFQKSIALYVFDGTNWESVPSIRTANVFMNLRVPPTSVVQGTWSYANGSAYTSEGVRFNASGAQNDGCIYQVDLAAGTYQLAAYFGAQASGGIVTTDFSVDGGTTWTAIGTDDLYNASNQAPREGLHAGVVVPSSGVVLLRLRVLSKNASSSGYGVQLMSANWMRTA